MPRSKTTESKSFVGVESCYYCDQGKSLFMNMRMRPTIPDRFLRDVEPCDACKEKYKEHVLLVEILGFETQRVPARNSHGRVIRGEADEIQVPQLTGNWIAMPREMAPQIFNPQSMVDAMLNKGVAYIDQESMNKMTEMAGVDKDKAGVTILEGAKFVPKESEEDGGG